jgi:hypothetical protein
VEVQQGCIWRFLWFQGTFQMNLLVSQDPHSYRVTFRLLESSFLRDFRGCWNISNLSANDCQVIYTLSVEPRITPPDRVMSYTSTIFKRQIAQLMDDLAGYARNERKSVYMQQETL